MAIGLYDYAYDHSFSKNYISKPYTPFLLKVYASVLHISSEKTENYQIIWQKMANLLFNPICQNIKQVFGMRRQ